MAGVCWVLDDAAGLPHQVDVLDGWEHGPSDVLGRLHQLLEGHGPSDVLGRRQHRLEGHGPSDVLGRDNR